MTVAYGVSDAHREAPLVTAIRFVASRQEMFSPVAGWTAVASVLQIGMFRSMLVKLNMFTEYVLQVKTFRAIMLRFKMFAEYVRPILLRLEMFIEHVLQGQLSAPCCASSRCLLNMY